MKCFIIFLILGFYRLSGLSQDCLVFLQANHGGNPIKLSIGDSFYISGAQDNLSFQLQNRAAILIKAATPVSTEVENWRGTYSNMFFYSEESERPGIVGTDQWSNGHYPRMAYCVARFNPEPPIYIPVDPANGHPGSRDKNTNYQFIPGKEYVFVKRAFFWENAEQLNCDLDPDFNIDPHGAAGDIKINICHPDVSNYPPWVLENHPHLWRINNNCIINCDFPLATTCNLSPNESGYDICGYYNASGFLDLKKNKYFGATLLGPTYFSPPACDGTICKTVVCDHEYAPSPHNEWVDGPWGVFYTQFPLFSWEDDEYKGLDSVTILISEADAEEFLIFSTGNYEDVLGYETIHRNDSYPKLLKIGMSGWVVIDKQKIRTPENAEVADYYWYPLWKEDNPELVLGPVPKNDKTRHFFIEGDSLFIGCDDNDPGACFIMYKEGNRNLIKNFFNILIEPMKYRKYVLLDEKAIPVDSFYHYISVACSIPSENCQDNLPLLLSSIDTNSIIVRIPLVDTFSIFDLHNLRQLKVFTPNMRPSPLGYGAGTYAYRKKGAQYNPYHTFQEVERFVPPKDSVAVLGGIIPAGIHLTKQMTYLPVDKDYYRDKSAIDNPTQNKTYKIHPARNSNQTLPRDELFVYPNPIGEEGKIYFKVEEEGNVGLFIVNQLGQRTKILFNSNAIPGVYDFNIYREDLSVGLNLIVLEINGRRTVQKLVKVSN